MNELLLLCFSVAPIVWLFLAFCVFHMPGHVACPCALLLAALLAFYALGLGPAEIITAALEGALFALWPILLVVVSAMILYKYSVETGGMETIKSFLTGISRDKRVLALILAWGFGGFLEGIAGFGVPVLIPGSILVALGFNPMLAVVTCLVANSMPTPFAAIGTPVAALAGVTGLDPGVLGAGIAMQLFIPCIILPFFLVMLVGGGIRGLKGVSMITLISGLSFALPILLISKFLGPELPTLLGSVCAIVCTTAASKRFYRQDAHNKRFEVEAPPVRISGGARPMSLFQACLPFALVLIIVTAISLLKPLHDVLSKVGFEAVVYAGEGGHTLSFAVLLTPGVLILVSIVIAAFLQRRRFSELVRIAGTTVYESRKTALTIITIVAMAKIMDYSGMTAYIALILIAIFAGYYPLVAPVIGMIGTFITGSDTTCAILFGSLQAGAARAIGVDPAWIASSNLSAAAAGKMISPQSVAIGLRIGGLDGREGEIIRKTLKYALVCTAIISLITYAGTI